LAVFAAGGRLDAPLAEERFVSHEHPGLLPLVERFLATHRLRVEHACVGVAGPVRDGRCTATNLPWVVDADELARALGIPQAWVINDLEATAYGLAVLGPADFVTLARGDPTAQGNACLIAAGTGLGEAGLYWDGQDHRPFACEGGHASFAPTSDLEIELLQALRRRWEHVSWERVCSGPGLVAVYAFLRDSGRGVEEPWVAEALRTGDPAAAIAEAARGDRSPLCARARFLRRPLRGGGGQSGAQDDGHRRGLRRRRDRAADRRAAARRGIHACVPGQGAHAPAARGHARARGPRRRRGAARGGALRGASSGVSK